jgi:phosphatidylglycerophosphatase A
MTEVEPRKPRFALFIATAAGLGYLPKAPGTWGSLGGVLVTLAFFRYHQFPDPFVAWVGRLPTMIPYIVVEASLALFMAALGLWSANRVCASAGTKDPQFVVIDEVSGQMIALLFSAGESTLDRTHMYDVWNVQSWHGFVNWKYLLVGFILFRVFDIWKPFPARQAESLPGGWGIMADDWVAGIYAALGLWIARMLGL